MKRAKAEPKYIKPKIVTKRSSVNVIDVYAPPINLLCKLGSIIVHFDEGIGRAGHGFDWMAARSLLADRQVQDWMEQMTALGLLPVKRQ